MEDIDPSLNKRKAGTEVQVVAGFEQGRQGLGYLVIRN